MLINWNGGEMAKRCLASLLEQTHQVGQRIVVDNGSTDGSLEELAGIDPQLDRIHNSTNRGFAVAANQGIAAASGEWVLLLNQDIELEPDYVARLLAAGGRDARVGSLTGKLLRRSSAGETPAVVDSTGHILYRNGWASNRGEGLPDQADWDRPGEVFGVSAAAALYRRSMLSEVSEGSAQPFDERFFAYIEDVDLDWRARWLGWTSWYEPVVAWHHRGGSGARRSPATLRHILRNRLLLVANNDLWPGSLTRLPGVLALTLITALQFGLESPGALRGITDALRLLPASQARRRFLRLRASREPREMAAWMRAFPYRDVLRGRLFGGRRRAAAG